MNQRTHLDREMVESALREIAAAPEQYRDLIAILNDPEKRKDVGALMTQIGKSVSHVRQSSRVIVPALRDSAGVLRSGVNTSEFKAMSWVQKFLTLIAIAAPGLEAFLALTQEMQFSGNSMWVTGVSAFLKALLSGVYTVGRTAIKEDALKLSFEIEEMEDEDVDIPDQEDNYDRP